MPGFRMYPLRANNVLELYEQRHYIDMDPVYQRLSVWDREKQAMFIDSVINGVDTPKIYLHAVVRGSPSASLYRYSVIDGKQRILALIAFIQNEIRLPGDFRYFDNEEYDARGLTYDELLKHYPLLRARFDGYGLSIVLVEADDVELIEELFWRLNIQISLTAPEQRNAMGGPMPIVIRRIARSSFFKESIRIRNDRFQHLDLSAKFAYICYCDGVVDTKKTLLDSFVLTMKAARRKGLETASRETLGALEDRANEILEYAFQYFGKNSPLLGSVGRVTLYFHLLRMCVKLGIEVPIDSAVLERFNSDVTTARERSQRMSRGSGESLLDWESELLAFDQEKQSLNDRRAIERQYMYLRRYVQRICGVELPALS